MRMMLKVSIPVDTGNAAIRDGSIVKKIQTILADLKPEAAYFTALGKLKIGRIVGRKSETLAQA